MKRALLLRLWYLPALAIFTMFGFSALKVDFLPEISFRVVFGFIPFLKDARAEAVFDPRWLPWILASFAAIVVTHRLLVSRKGKVERLDGIGTSLSLASIPVLLALSISVLGGFWTAWRSVVTRPMAIDYPDKAGSQLRFGMELLRSKAFNHASRANGRFPDRLEELDEWAPYYLERLRSFSSDAGPGDPLIYLGAGLGPQSDRNLALLITPRFEGDEGEERWLVTIGGEEKKISEEELDGWIRSSLEGRKR
ncbi:hypothetical protein OJ996_03260 [Luteolibacter sp. GHJ8]|uniref:Uncharacterized protein n=1 Tax=Luteolibacter rhizosphaerae TaxID=2989719 RepID=A0ABT3FYC3_9BACT|nr:hypothetical protein [Luteolibacter rhizosphaerae]MCW1912577.1 hypothetical protein [Luteolibacter rhizosphaerae]